MPNASHVSYVLQNLKLVHKLRAIADRKGCTQGQLAVSVVHHHRDNVFPIPGELTSAAVTQEAGHLVSPYVLSLVPVPDLPVSSSILAA